MELLDHLDAAKNVAVVVGSLYLLTVVGGLLWSLLGATRAFILAPLGISRTNLKKYGQWAVVTGASEGIGRGYALELARQGLDVVIMSRSEEKLQKVSSEIKEKYGRNVRVIAADFSAGQDIYPQIAEKLEDLDIGILVNNVGFTYEYPDYLTGVPQLRLRKLIEINCQALVQMTRLILPKMADKKRGAVINLSSAGTDAIWPMYSVYGASKVFVNYFSAGLCKEYEEKGICVQNVKPYVVATAMSGFEAGLFAPTGETYTRAAVATIGVQKETYGYWAHALQAYIINRIPSWLLERMLFKFLLDMRAKGLEKKAREAKEQ